MKRKTFKFDKKLEKEIVDYLHMKIINPSWDCTNMHKFDLIPSLILYEMLRRCRG